MSNLKHKLHDIQISKGDVVSINGDEKNQVKWNTRIVQRINKGKDGNIRSVKLQCNAGTSYTTFISNGTDVFNL